MTKMRFIETFGRKEYIDQMEYNDCITLLKVRLNMIETKCNVKGNYLGNLFCQICNKELDTTEHLLRCEGLGDNETKNISKVDIKVPNEKLAKYVSNNIKKREDLGFSIKFGTENE